MDRIFDPKEYETWLNSRSGRNYLAASCSLLDHLLDCRPGQRVLDIGCGQGSHLQHLKAKRLLTSGLEANPLLRHQAQQRLGEQADIILGDAYDLPFEDNSFDAVVMVNSLEYMDRPAMALAEAARVSRGRLCVITFNSWALNRL